MTIPIVTALLIHQATCNDGLFFSNTLIAFIGLTPESLTYISNSPGLSKALTHANFILSLNVSSDIVFASVSAHSVNLLIKLSYLSVLFSQLINIFIISFVLNIICFLT